MSQTVRPHRNLSLMEEVLITSHQSPDPNDDSEDEDDKDVEDLRDVAGKKSWDQLFKNSTDFLLFGSLIMCRSSNSGRFIWRMSIRCLRSRIRLLCKRESSMRLATYET
jgi:hypothetical protein